MHNFFYYFSIFLILLINVEIYMPIDTGLKNDIKIEPPRLSDSQVPL